MVKCYSKSGNTKNMSRIGKKIIKIPEKTEVSFAGNAVTVKGPLGTLTKTIRPLVEVKVADGNVTIAPKSNTIESRALWGTIGSHITNMIAGVNTPYTKKLIIEGIGFKADVKGSDLHLALGFSHPVKRPIPSDLKVTSDKNILTVTGIDCEKVGQFASSIRSLKKPEPYKGKGIRYEGEVIRRKQGKKAV